MHEVTEAAAGTLPVGGGGGETSRQHLTAGGRQRLDRRGTHPISYCRQQASLKSVTGDSSAWTAWALNQRLFRSMTAFSASSSRRNYTRGTAGTRVTHKDTHTAPSTARTHPADTPLVVPCIFFKPTFTCVELVSSYKRPANKDNLLLYAQWPI